MEAGKPQICGLCDPQSVRNPESESQGQSLALTQGHKPIVVSRRACTGRPQGRRPQMKDSGLSCHT